MSSEDSKPVVQAEAWWKEAIVFQIWPHSFCDSNGDGIGDLGGITSKLDYLKDLGVDIIWLSPVYPTPYKDYGYDISDFKDINPDYGTLEDWDHLRAECEKRGMKIIMDLVLNHSSDRHAWFIQSKASKDSPYRDYYYWKDKREGDISEPNNWGAVFGGSAWTWDENTQQYYLHKYLDSQPDLNWTNPKLREEMYDVCRFWLDRGCAGFRLDAVSRLSVPDDMPDAEIQDQGAKYQNADKYMKHGPRMHEYLGGLHKEVFSKYDCMTVGEMSGTTPEKGLTYVHPDRKELQMIFHFELMHLDSDPLNRLMKKEWSRKDMKKIIASWQRIQSHQGGYTSNYLSNHDQGRPVSRFGSDSPENRALSAKLLAVMECTLPGTLYIFQGEELGTKNVPKDFKLDDLRDVQSLQFWDLQRERGADMEKVWESIQLKGRDNGRLPVMWDSEKPNAGFTTGTPWMKMDTEDFAEWAASKQVDDKNSVRNFWKDMIKLRKENKLFTYGIYQDLDPEHEEVLAYTLSDAGSGESRYLVLLNFSSKDIAYKLPPERRIGRVRLLRTNWVDGEADNSTDGDDFSLRRWEARIYSL